jgi:hypothetical protein
MRWVLVASAVRPDGGEQAADLLRANGFGVEMLGEWIEHESKWRGVDSLNLDPRPLEMAEPVRPSELRARRRAGRPR